VFPPVAWGMLRRIQVWGKNTIQEGVGIMKRGEREEKKEGGVR